MQPDEWDVVVIGSGAAGLTAAVTAAVHGLSVAIVEKEPVFGGTTALSEGMIWVPCGNAARSAGIADSADAAMAYMSAAAGRYSSPERVRAYVETAPVMLDFVERHTLCRFTLSPTSPDYHQDLPGATVGARAYNPGVFDGRLLGGDFQRLRPPLATTLLLGGMTIASADLPHFMAMRRSPRSALHAAGLIGRYGLDRLTGHRRGTRIANGNGIVAALLLAARQHGARLATSTAAVRLTFGSGRVDGVEIESDGRHRKITARRGVVIASGGFPGDDQLRRRHFAHLPLGLPHHSLAPATNVGDGLRLALAAGATLDADVAQPAAWTPVSLVPQRDGSSVPFPHYMDRGKPGVIAVDAGGRRFTNEADPYHRFVPRMIEAMRKVRSPLVHIVADHRAVRAYGLGAVPPAPASLRPFLRSGYLLSAPTFRELADRMGLPPQDFVSAVDAFNSEAREGRDPQFCKGSTPFNRAYGDVSWQPNPCVAPLATPPYYAIRLYPGDIATFIGLKADANARVLDASGTPIAGLFVAGNDMTSPFGGDYPAAGITIGAAMTFGFMAARTLACPTA